MVKKLIRRMLQLAPAALALGAAIAVPLSSKWVV